MNDTAQTVWLARRQNYGGWTIAIATAASAWACRAEPAGLSVTAVAAGLSFLGLVLATVAIIISSPGNEAFRNLRSRGSRSVGLFIQRIRQTLYATIVLTCLGIVGALTEHMSVAREVAALQLGALVFVLFEAHVLGGALTIAARKAIMSNPPPDAPPAPWTVDPEHRATP